MSIKQAKGLITLILSLLILDVFSQSAICSYSYRKRIAFDPTKVSGTSDLVNFTALISITSDNDLRVVASSGHVQSANGYDIIFTADDGVTKLDFQLEKYTSTTGELVVWVRLPLLSKTYTTNIYMYYGNAAITTDQSVSSAWNSSYKGVWHLHNNSFNDGTATGNNGTNNGSANLATAKIGGGRSFAGTGTNYLQLPLSGASGGNGTSTIEFWGLMGTAVSSRYFFGESTTQNATYTDRVQLYIGDNTGNLYLGLGSNHAIQTNVQLLTANTWYHIALAWATTGTGVGSYSVFVNGVQKGTGSYSGFSNIYTSGDMGNDGNIGQRTEELTGSIDEVRVTSTALSASWLLTEYNNQNSPSAFYTITAEPKVWNGTTNSNFNTASNWLSNAAPASGDDIIINNGTNQPDLQANQQVNSIYIRTAATLSLSTFNLLVHSDISNCGTITGNTGSVTLNSTASQTQNLSGSGTYNLTSLVIDNTFSTSPSVVLSKDVNVAGALVLTSGIVFTSTINILALSAGATSSGGSAASFISGPLSKTGSTDFVFPVGKGSSWRRAGVSNLTAPATFRAEYFNTPYTNSLSVNSPLDNVSHLEYWQVDQVTGSANADLSLYWENATASGIDNCSDLTIARFNGAAWDEKPGATVPGSSCSGTGTGTVTTVAVVTAFSPFTFGSKIIGENPLPIELTEFKANCAGSSVMLNWTTASEKNNTGFILEKSTDGVQWTTIGHLAGTGNSTQHTNYSLSDTGAATGQAYYRLSQTDTGGKPKVYKIITNNCSGSNDNLLVYPNPAGEELRLEMNLSADYGENELKILDDQGRLCFKQNITMSRGRSIFKIEHHLPAGSYCILFSSALPAFKAQKLIIVN